MKDLAIIILNFNGSNDTIECIQSIDNSKTRFEYDIYIFDNGSEITEQKVLSDFIEERKSFQIIKYEDFTKMNICGNMLILSDTNWGFAGGNNRVINVIYKKYDHILLLNNDTIVTEDFVEKMLAFMQGNEKVGFASCRINNYYNHDLLWNCGGMLYPWGIRRYYSDDELNKMPEVIQTEFITGCALFINSSIISKFGALSNDFFHGEEDFNFCWRMKQNKISGFCLNQTLVYHKVSVSSKNTGTEPGKIVGYYVNRLIDMKKFYPLVIWHIWKEGMMFLLMINWKRNGISKENVKKMIIILRKSSKMNTVSKEDTIKIWNMKY